MSRIPRPEEFPGIRARLRFYKITAWITGILLLALVVEMVLKYAFHLEIEMFGPFGFFALVQEGTVTAFNLSRWILIIHGWFYVVYLIAAYLVWLKMRWELIWLLAMAGGGVVPFLSFITESLMHKRAVRELDQAQQYWDEREAEDAKLAEVEGSLSDEQRAELDAEVDAEVRRRVEDQ
ncbi:DUF3817 domain-containing protein [Gulosibacter molinativorax]|uniref:DUF3817 domain-containing protein n=1 Tax=Gulosibacter molinativorax TaxID=256821 RepID=A0ABT7C463_9MICO|nr:DUF3817 domain-containing protein [Gulosibacter molinativorax]MDJ1370013.1 DUF3817 domain-containing protein [Gulosibacter molinativorax]QUY63797.1 Membrane protein [Gulosibacter molinativorax]